MCPAEVKTCLHVLESAGFEAYLVGGCVRDTLLGIPAHDYDVTTSALPSDVCALFARTACTGIAHGTVTVLLGARSIEVTTFRSDGAYTDGRHPSTVSFGTDLIHDLKRRDFTINAMAMDANGLLIDPYGGQEDLQRKCIRTVGNGHTRFSEDALRLLRAIRFSARFDFDIEPATHEAMLACKAMLRHISMERVREELFGMLLAPHSARSNLLFSLDLLPRVGDFTAFAHYPNQILPRLAALTRQMQAPELPRTLKCSRQVIRAIEAAATLDAPRTDADWRRVFAQQDAAAALAVAGWWNSFDSYERVSMQSFPRSVTQLALSAQTLMQRGYQGQALGAMQRRLLDAVLEEPKRNTPELLTQLVLESKENM